MTLAAEPFWAVFLRDGARWRLAVLLLGALTAAIAVLSSFLLPYWRFADQDLVVAYNGLLLNEGLPQEYFDHPGYGYFLVLAHWYKLLHAVGLLEVYRLGALPAPGAGFEPAWQSVIVAGRGLSAVLGAAFVVAFTFLVRPIVRSRGIALLAGGVLLVGAGVQSQTQVMRTELLSGACAVIATLLVFVAARTAHSRTRLPCLGIAGLLVALAMVTKVQALLSLLAVPILALALGEPARADGWRRLPGGWRWTVAAALVALAVALGMPAVELVRHGIETATTRASAPA